MGRKKKKNVEFVEENDIDEEDVGQWSILHGDAKRSIAAIFLFAVSLVFILSFFDGAGLLGDFLNKILGQIFGWGKWIFPPVLLVMGVFLLQRRLSSFAEFLKLSGLIVAFISLLGFFHLYLDGNMKAAAKAGEGGGFIGYMLAHALETFTGITAGTIILLALFGTGVIVAFNVSLIRFFEQLRDRWMRMKEKRNESEDDDESVFDEELETSLDSEDESEDDVRETETKSLKQSKGKDTSLEDQNIRSIEFVGEDNGGDDEEDGEEDAEKGIGKHQKGVGMAVVPIVKYRAPKKKATVHKHWQLPSLDLLDEDTGQIKGVKNEQNAAVIQKTLRHFGIDVEIGEAKTGPTVTQYTFRPAVGVKLSRITALSDNLALALAAHSIRIEAPIPGKSLIGIEVPNQSKAIVRLRNILTSPMFKKKHGPLSVVLGADVSGEYIVADLAKMPHLLVAGATMSGKSVCVNTLLLSLLFQNSPDDLKMILVDPKRVELSLYNKIPHLLTDVIVDNKKVVNVLKSMVSEMERRYKILQEVGSRDLESYHEKYNQGEKKMTMNPDTNELVEEELEKLPYIVIVIDEMADLMMAHAKEVEGLVVRIAQMARAVGIHLILATQRPSVEVLTGLIKANITTRIAFQVATQIDSRTILDQSGAEKLLGRGDMLYLSTDSAQPRRIQGVFISESEVKRVADFLRKQRLEEGNEDSLYNDIIKDDGNVSGKGHMPLNLDASLDDDDHGDSLYNEAKEAVIQAGKASASLLQRRLRVGYSRAARLIDLLEEDGVVGPADGAKPREVYILEGDLHEKSSEEHDDDPEKEQEQRNKWHV